MSISYRFATLVLLSNLSFAESSVGLAFSHRDWSLVCDNTRTCRAAGYSDRKDENSVSVLLVRQAGAKTLVQGLVMIDAKYTAPELRINNRVIGTLEHNSHPISELSEAQTAILLRSLLRKSNIDFLADGIRWHLSDKGAAAVLLKMDEFQGRIGTPGAIVRKGKKSEDTVYPHEQIPSITHAPFKKALPGDDQFFRMNQEALLEAIRDSVPTRNNECSGLLFDDKGMLNSSGHEVVRLTDTKMLFSCICRRDANNEYYGYWVVNDSAPFEPALVTITGQYSRNKATLRSHHEGDCSGVNEWTWDGNRFVLTNAVAWKICRKIDGEDAWRLPTVITNVF